MTLEGAKFICLDEAGNHGEIILAKGRKFTMGYYVSCDYVLVDERAKGIHCEIECDAFGRVTIRNLSPDKPILVNGTSVEIKRILLNNSKLSILDKEYLWIFSKSSSNEFEDLNMETVTTPLKQIGIPEQPPNSCPDFKLHRDIPKRFTVHNFLYCIQSDEEGNISSESNDENINEDTEIKDSNGNTSLDKIKENQKRSITPEPSSELGKSKTELLETPKMNVINCSQDKENRSTQKENKQLLNMCHLSDVVITSFSPRETGVKIAKSFATIIKQKVMVRNSPITPKSVYSTPKGEMTETHGKGDENVIDLINFHTPSTSKKEMGNTSHSAKVHSNSSMYLIDLTTPFKQRPASPYLKSALKTSAKKYITQSIDKSYIKLSGDEQLGIAALPTTPDILSNNPLETPSSVISVNSSTDASSVIEVTSDSSNMVISATAATGLNTPMKAHTSAGSGTPKRTPHSLMKRALLTSAKKQNTTSHISTQNSTTPRKEPINRIPLRNNLTMLRTPNTPMTSTGNLSSSQLPRRQSMSTPTRKNLSSRARFDNSASSSNLALNLPLSSPKMFSRRSSLNPISAVRDLPTSTPMSGSRNKSSATCKTSPLHKVRKCLGGMILSSHISKSRKAILLPGSTSKITSIKDKSPQQIMSDRLVTRARNSLCVTPMQIRARTTCSSSSHKDGAAQSVKAPEVNTVSFANKQSADKCKVDNLSRTFIIDSDEEENIDTKKRKNTAKDATFSPEKDSNETEKSIKKLVINETNKEQEPIEIPLDVEEVSDTTKETKEYECKDEENTPEKENNITETENNVDNKANNVTLLGSGKMKPVVTEESFAEVIQDIQENNAMGFSDAIVDIRTKSSHAELPKSSADTVDKVSVDESARDALGDTVKALNEATNIIETIFGEESVTQTSQIPKKPEHQETDTSNTCQKDIRKTEKVFIEKINDETKYSDGQGVNLKGDEQISYEYKPIVEDITLESSLIEKETKENEEIIVTKQHIILESSLTKEEVKSEEIKEENSNKSLNTAHLITSSRVCEIYEPSENLQQSNMEEKTKIQHKMDPITNVKEMEVAIYKTKNVDNSDSNGNELELLETNKVAKKIEVNTEISEQIEEQQNIDSKPSSIYNVTIHTSDINIEESTNKTETIEIEKVSQVEIAETYQINETGEEKIAKISEEPDDFHVSESNTQSAAIVEDRIDGALEDTNKLLEEIEDVLNKSDEIKQKHLDELHQYIDKPLTEEFDSEQLSEEKSAGVEKTQEDEKSVQKLEEVTLGCGKIRESLDLTCSAQVIKLTEPNGQNVNVNLKDELEGEKSIENVVEMGEVETPKNLNPNENENNSYIQSENASNIDKNEIRNLEEAEQNSKKVENITNFTPRRSTRRLSQSADNPQPSTELTFTPRRSTRRASMSAETAVTYTPAKRTTRRASSSIVSETPLTPKRITNRRLSVSIDDDTSKSSTPNLQKAKTPRKQFQQSMVIPEEMDNVDDIILIGNEETSVQDKVQFEKEKYLTSNLHHDSTPKHYALQTLRTQTPRKNMDQSLIIPEEVGEDVVGAMLVREIDPQTEQFGEHKNNKVALAETIFVKDSDPEEHEEQNSEISSTSRVTNIKEDQVDVERIPETYFVREENTSICEEKSEDLNPNEKEIFDVMQNIISEEKQPLDDEHTEKEASKDNADFIIVSDNTSDNLGKSENSESKEFNQTTVKQCQTDEVFKKEAIPRTAADHDVAIETSSEYHKDKEVQISSNYSETSIDGEQKDVLTPIAKRSVEILDDASKTPLMSGVRELLKTPKAQNSTPQLLGIRDLVRTPKDTPENEQEEWEKLTVVANLVRTPEKQFSEIATPICKKQVKIEADVPKTPLMTGVRELLKTPKPEPQTPLLGGISELVDSPKGILENEIEEPAMTSALIQTPEINTFEMSTAKDRKHISTTPLMAGMRELLKTPKVELPTPKLAGIRNLLQTPKPNVENEQEEIEKLSVVAKLVRTPECSKNNQTAIEESPSSSMKNDNLQGVKELLKTPKNCTTPRFRGIRELMQTPKDNLTPLTSGVKELLESPTSAQIEGLQAFAIKTIEKAEITEDFVFEKSSADEISSKATENVNLKGVKELLKTPKCCSTPAFKGLKELVQTPKVGSSPLLSGIKELMDNPAQHKDKELEQYLKTPTAKNIMIPSMPSSTVIEKSSDSIEVSTECDLNSTIEDEGTNLEELFKTPSHFVEHITTSYYGEEEAEQQDINENLNNTKNESLQNVLNKTAEEAFDKLVGQDSQIHTPIRRRYARKSFTVQTPQMQSPFTAADVLSDLPKTDVEEWIETLDEAEPPTILESEDSQEEQEIVEHEIIGISATNIEEVTNAEYSLNEDDKQNISFSESIIPETCTKVYLTENTFRNKTTASLIYTECNDPLSNIDNRKELKEIEKRSLDTPIDAEISGISLLDQTVDSLQDEPSMLDEPLVVEEPSMFEEALIVSDNESEAENTLHYADVLEVSQDEGNDLSEPLMLSDSDDLSQSQETNEIVKTENTLEVTQGEDEVLQTSNFDINVEEKSMLEKFPNIVETMAEDPLEADCKEISTEMIIENKTLIETNVSQSGAECEFKETSKDDGESSSKEKHSLVLEDCLINDIFINENKETKILENDELENSEVIDISSTSQIKKGTILVSSENIDGSNKESYKNEVNEITIEHTKVISLESEGIFVDSSATEICEETNMLNAEQVEGEENISSKKSSYEYQDIFIDSSNIDETFADEAITEETNAVMCGVVTKPTVENNPKNVSCFLETDNTKEKDVSVNEKVIEINDDTNDSAEASKQNINVFAEDTKETELSQTKYIDSCSKNDEIPVEILHAGYQSSHVSQSLNQTVEESYKVSELSSRTLAIDPNSLQKIPVKNNLIGTLVTEQEFVDEQQVESTDIQLEHSDFANKLLNISKKEATQGTASSNGNSTYNEEHLKASPAVSGDPETYLGQCSSIASENETINIPECQLEERNVTITQEKIAEAAAHEPMNDFSTENDNSTITEQDHMPPTKEEEFYKNDKLILERNKKTLLSEVTSSSSPKDHQPEELVKSTDEEMISAGALSPSPEIIKYDIEIKIKDVNVITIPTSTTEASSAITEKESSKDLKLPVSEAAEIGVDEKNKNEEKDSLVAQDTKEIEDAQEVIKDHDDESEIEESKINKAKSAQGKRTVSESSQDSTQVEEIGTSSHRGCRKIIRNPIVEKLEEEINDNIEILKDPVPGTETEGEKSKRKRTTSESSQGSVKGDDNHIRTRRGGRRKLPKTPVEETVVEQEEEREELTSEQLMHEEERTKETEVPITLTEEANKDKQYVCRENENKKCVDISTEKHEQEKQKEETKDISEMHIEVLPTEKSISKVESVKDLSSTQANVTLMEKTILLDATENLKAQNEVIQLVQEEIFIPPASVEEIAKNELKESLAGKLAEETIEDAFRNQGVTTILKETPLDALKEQQKSNVSKTNIAKISTKTPDDDKQIKNPGEVTMSDGPLSSLIQDASGEQPLENPTNDESVVKSKLSNVMEKSENVENARTADESFLATERVSIFGEKGKHQTVSRGRCKPTVSESSQDSVVEDDKTGGKMTRRQIQDIPVDEVVIEVKSHNAEAESETKSSVKSDDIALAGDKQSVETNVSSGVEQIDSTGEHVPNIALEVQQRTQKRVRSKSTFSESSQGSANDNDTSRILRGRRNAQKTPIEEIIVENENDAKTRELTIIAEAEESKETADKNVDALSMLNEAKEILNDKSENNSDGANNDEPKVQPNESVLDVKHDSISEPVENNKHQVELAEDNQRKETSKDHESGEESKEINTKRGRKKRILQGTVLEEPTTSRKSRRKVQAAKVEGSKAEMGVVMELQLADINRNEVSTAIKATEEQPVEKIDEVVSHEEIPNEVQNSTIQTPKSSRLGKIDVEENVVVEVGNDNNESSTKTQTDKEIDMITHQDQDKMQESPETSNGKRRRQRKVEDSIEKNANIKDTVAPTRRRGGRHNTESFEAATNAVPKGRTTKRNRKTPAEHFTDSYKQVEEINENPAENPKTSNVLETNVAIEDTIESSGKGINNQKVYENRKNFNINSLNDTDGGQTAETFGKLTNSASQPSVVAAVDEKPTYIHPQTRENENIQSHDDEVDEKEKVAEKPQKSSRRKAVVKSEQHGEHQEELSIKTRRRRAAHDDSEKHNSENAIETKKISEDAVLSEVNIIEVNLQSDGLVNQHKSAEEENPEIKVRKGRRKPIIEDIHVEGHETLPPSKKGAVVRDIGQDHDVSGLSIKKRVGRKKKVDEKEKDELHQVAHADTSETTSIEKRKEQLGKEGLPDVINKELIHKEDTESMSANTQNQSQAAIGTPVTEEESKYTANSEITGRRRNIGRKKTVPKDHDKQIPEKIEKSEKSTDSENIGDSGNINKPNLKHEQEEHDDHNVSGGYQQSQVEIKKGRGRKKKNELHEKEEQVESTSSSSLETKHRNRKRKEPSSDVHDHTLKEEIPNDEKLTKEPESNVDLPTPQRAVPISKKVRKVFEHITAESQESEDTPGRRARNVPQRRAATAYHNYDETSDSETSTKTKKKTDSPRKSLEAVKKSPTATITTASIVSISPSPSVTAVIVTARGRTRKPTPKVQEFLEKERAKAETPKKRALLAAAVSADIGTPQRTPARRGRKPSTIETEVAGTPQDSKGRGRGRNAFPHNKVEETIVVSSVPVTLMDQKEIELQATPLPENSVKGRRGGRKAKITGEEQQNSDEPPTKKSLTLESEKQEDTLPSVEPPTPTRVAGRRNAAAAAKARIEEDALAAAAIDPPKRVRAKKVASKASNPVVVTADIHDHISEAEEEQLAKEEKELKGKSSSQKREHRLASASTVEGVEVLQNEIEVETIDKPANKRSRKAAVPTTTDSPAVPAKRSRKVKTLEEVAENETLGESNTGRGRGRDRKNVPLDGHLEAEATSNKQNADTSDPPKRGTRTRRK